MSTLTLISALPVVSTLSLSLSQIIINETSANNTLSRMTVGNFASQFLPTGDIISNADGTIAALDLDPLLEISSIGTDGLGTLTFNTLSAGQLLGNPTPSTGHVVAGPLTTYMDSAFGSVEGEIVYRGPSTWTALAPGTAGQVLTTGGTGAAPAWNTSSASLKITDGTHTVTTVNDIVLSTGLSLTASGTGTATLLASGGSSLPASAPLIGSNSGGTAVAVAVGDGLALSSGTLTAPGNKVILHGYSGDGTLANSGTCLIAIPPNNPTSYNYTFAGLATSLQLKVITAPTSNATLTAYNNGSAVGSVTIAASSTTPTITGSTGFTVTAGNEFILQGPTTADATLGRIISTLSGNC